MAEVLFKVIDIETTGLAPPAEIIEIGWTPVLFDTETKRATIQPTVEGLFGAPGGIPPETQAVHHITPRMVEGKPPCGPDDLRSAVDSVKRPFAMVAHNAAFERAFIPEDVIGPMRWICTFKAALRAWPDAPAHNNQTLRYWRGLDLLHGYAMPPHRAGPDAYVSAHILADLLATQSIADLVRWTKEPRFYAVCPIGKFRGKPWSSVEQGFLQWMLKQPDMEADLVHAARLEIDRRQSGDA